MDLGLEGKVALVTGSERGTGSVIAQRLAEEGATVIAHGFAQDSAEPLRAQGVRHTVWGDLCSDAGAAQVAQQALAAAGRVDILVNNYGTASDARWSEAETAVWLDMYEKNVLAAVRLIRLLTPQMRERGWGRVIQLGTIGSTQPNPLRPAYYAAKSALASIAVTLSQELAQTGITVNTVSPGYIRTPEVEAAFRAKARRAGWAEAQGDWASIEARIVAQRFPNPVGRIATREEVADLVCFVASTRAAFINGQNLRIDGGALGLVQ
ncbi:SDR family NAD(P)-dependent oxidoreductase [Extensimonas vulgaris]|uniref:NAD(P)-dependent dehydrogenase (Short-subunit alcohol dehydrogenase family) n=1 Tax=Extensimonas vulgaris TaxID=1031594 RepID=A0A369ALL2_9BURK|nr:SDR family oxidoreductase [Extensimonas vulgaris]RCX09176.1 NAD(P)-dependent dehydrogenase (short-subunit alcohol dehydrogenase family) [Extensimonas vulgaris]TWI37759.1 NAD(P)-dependent dehydrogenase (short-subunit alcohol dehydrogenase family) [Extensimonas vulgaris]TXD15929.1 SDR family oxidoreductase [Extensimonas vulgaris]